MRIATLTALVVVILPMLPRVALGDQKLAERFLQRQVQGKTLTPAEAAQLRKAGAAEGVLQNGKKRGLAAARRKAGLLQQPLSAGPSLSPKDAKRLQRIARAARNRAFWASQPDLISMQVQYGMAADAWFQRVATPHY